VCLRRLRRLRCLRRTPGPAPTLAAQDYADKYTASRDTYIEAAEALKLATGPYKASRDAYVAASKFLQALRIGLPAVCPTECSATACVGEWFILRPTMFFAGADSDRVCACV
jgi:hypothetical protein